MVIKRWMIERHLNEWKGRIMGAINDVIMAHMGSIAGRLVAFCMS